MKINDAVHTELRLCNTILYFEVNVFIFLFSVYVPHWSLCVVLLWLGDMLHKFTLNSSLYYFQRNYLNILQSCLTYIALLIGSQKWDLNVSINPHDPLYQNYHCQFSFFRSSICPTRMQAPYLHPIPSKICLNYSLQSLFLLSNLQINPKSLLVGFNLSPLY